MGERKNNKTIQFVPKSILLYLHMQYLLKENVFMAKLIHVVFMKDIFVLYYYYYNILYDTSLYTLMREYKTTIIHVLN